MKKMTAVLFLVLKGVSGFSQGMPVIDITNVIQSIENGYKLYEQLQAMYNQVQTSIEMLKQARDSFYAFDINQLDARDPLGSWRAIMTYGNRMMAYEENIEYILNNKNMRIGTQSYSLADLMRNPNPYDYANEAAGFVAVDPFERKLTLEEKAIFHSKYGMSYGHYIRYNTLGEMLAEKAAETYAYMSGMDEQVKKDREVVDHILSTDTDTASVVAQMQKNNQLLAAQVQQTITLSQQIGKIGALYGQWMAINQEQRRAANEAKGALDYMGAESAIKMLDRIDMKEYK